MHRTGANRDLWKGMEGFPVLSLMSAPTHREVYGKGSIPLHNSDAGSLEPFSPGRAGVLEDASAERVLPVLQRYVAGESLQTLAAETGVHRATLYRWMLAYEGGEYEGIITATLVRRIAEADKELDEACDPCDIARAREKARYARMDYERRRPHLYGQRTHVTVETAGNLGDRIRRARERDIEGESKVVIDSEVSPASISHVP